MNTLTKIITYLIIFISTFLLSHAMADELILTPHIGLGLEYDDNINFDEVEGNEREDLIYVTKPGFDLSRKTERFTADITTELDIHEYKDEEEFDYVDQDYKGVFNYELTERLSANLETSYSRDTDPETSESDDTGLLEQKRSARTRKRLLGSFTYQLDELTFTTLEIFYRKTNFKAKGPDDEVDSQSKKSTFSIERELSPEKIFGTFDLGYHHYNPESKTDRIREVDDVDTAFFKVGGKYYFREISFIYGKIGLRHSETDFKVPVPNQDFLFYREVEENDVEVIGELGIESKFTEKLYGYINFTQDQRPSPTNGGEPDRGIIEGGLTYNITSELEANLQGTIDFIDSDENEVSSSDTDRDIINIRSSLKYNITPDLSASLTYRYTHEREEDDETIGDVTVPQMNTTTRHVIFFGFNWRFPYKM